MGSVTKTVNKISTPHLPFFFFCRFFLEVSIIIPIFAPCIPMHIHLVSDMILYLFLFLGVLGSIILVWTLRELYKSAKANNWVIG